MNTPLARFESREDAAAQLAGALQAYRGQSPLVLAIPNGGVPLGRELADALAGDLDVALVSRLALPGNAAATIGAITEHGWTYLLDGPAGGQPDPADVAKEQVAKLDRLRQQCAIYTSHRPRPDPRGRIVILADDGLATGATMMAAIHMVRRQHPARVVCAVPAGLADGLAAVRPYADEVVCLRVAGPGPDISHLYHCFPEVGDAEVRMLLRHDAATAGAEGGRALADAMPVDIDCGGAVLHGVLDAPANPAGLVLMVQANGHGEHTVRNQYVARKLNASRLATLLVDLIAPREPMRKDKRLDVALLTGRLRKVMQAVPGLVLARLRLPAVPLACFGTGTAAAAALRVAGEAGNRLRSLVLAAGRPDLAGAESLRNVAIPTLLVIGAGDPEGIRVNDLAFAALHCPRQLRLVAGAGRVFEEPAAIEDLVALANGWLLQSIAGAEPGAA